MTTNIAERIRQMRDALGLDQRSAAERAGLSQSMWSRIESGDKEPTLGQLIGVAGALGCTTESLTAQSTVSGRLQFAARTSRPLQSEADLSAMRKVKDRLAMMMEVDAHLRYIGVGVHHA